MHRPTDRSGWSEEDWAAYMQCQDEHDVMMAQVADREAQMEHGVIDSYDEYEFTWDDPVPRWQRPSPQPSLPGTPPATALRRAR